MPEIDRELIARLRYIATEEESAGQNHEETAVQYMEAAERYSGLSDVARARAQTYRTLVQLADALAAVDDEPSVLDLRIEGGRIVDCCPEGPLRFTAAQARATAAELITLAAELDPPTDAQ